MFMLEFLLLPEALAFFKRLKLPVTFFVCSVGCLCAILDNNSKKECCQLDGV